MPSVSNKQNETNYLQWQNKPKLHQVTATPTQFDWQTVQHSKEYKTHKKKLSQSVSDQPTISKDNSSCGWTENIKRVSCWQAAVGHKQQHAAQRQIPLVYNRHKAGELRLSVSNNLQIGSFQVHENKGSWLAFCFLSRGEVKSEILAMVLF